MQEPIEWAMGQLSPSWLISIDTDDNKPLDLTNVTTGQLGFLIYNSSRVQISTGGGTFSIKNAAQGLVGYALGTNDVPTIAGTYYVRVKVNFGGATPFFTDYIKWVISA